MKKCHRIDGLLVATLLAFSSPAAEAQTAVMQPLDQIASAATGFVREQLTSGGEGSVMHVTVVALDPRLRLPVCRDKPEGFTQGTVRIAARMTVGVRCALPQWSVYVPVKIESEMRVLTLRQAAPRLGKLVAADVELRSLRVPGLSADYLTDVGQLAGRHLRMPAAPGTPLTTGLLVRDTLVKRGQRVTLIAAVGGIEVRAQGEAIADANAAGRVRVLNLSSRKIIEGRVETEDRVRVDL